MYQETENLVDDAFQTFKGTITIEICGETFTVDIDSKNELAYPLIVTCLFNDTNPAQTLFDFATLQSLKWHPPQPPID